MSKETGFTLVELMVSLAIIGILIATAIPTYQTWRQRAYGQEATIMAKQILDGQIVYYLEHNDFFPKGASSSIVIDPDIGVIQQDIDDIADALKITIPVNRPLKYQLVNYDTYFLLRVWATFSLFKEGQTDLIATVSEDGDFYIFGQ